MESNITGNEALEQEFSAKHSVQPGPILKEHPLICVFGIEDKLLILKGC